MNLMIVMPSLLESRIRELSDASTLLVRAPSGFGVDNEAFVKGGVV